MRPAPDHLRPRSAGLTLAELSVSLAIIATLMVAVASIMVLTGRAVGMTAAQASEAKIDDVVATMASEQRMALTVNDITPTSITFTVADRNNDGMPEKISYYVSADGKLLRQVNGATAVAILTDVTKFSVGWIPKVASPAAPPAQVESTTDELLFAHETGLTSNQSMSTTSWAAQSFKPTLRSDATSWRVTLVQIMATRTASSTTTAKWNVMLCPSDATGKPNTLAPIETQTLALNTLAMTAGWSPVIAFSTQQNLDPKQRYWIVVSQTQVTTTGSVAYDPASSDFNDPYASTFSGIWSTYTTRDMKVRVYGRYKYPQQ
jgi:hypothetical protein